MLIKRDFYLNKLIKSKNNKRIKVITGIRSQDKYRLTNANNIEIVDRENGEVWIYVDDQKYAVYSTKEKALKVLDEIQRIIHLTDGNYVFTMPQDDMVK